MITAVTRGVQDCQNPVIPAKAGIQTEDFNHVSLDSRLRGSDEKNERAVRHHLPHHRGGEKHFLVDGVQYDASWCVYINRQEQIASSLLILHRLDPDQINGPVNCVITLTRIDDSTRKVVRTLCLPDGEKIVAKEQTLYFIQDKKIIFEKTYQELEIDTYKLSAGFTTDFDTEVAYLQPILEKLIRKHVQPQDSETEEQEK